MLTETKLTIPPAGPHLIARPQLLAQLNEGLGRRLTLVSAPAGAGKTSLVAAWLRDLQERAGEAGNRSAQGGARPATAWLSVDEGDNDARRLFAHLAAALGKAGSKSGDVVLGLIQNEPQTSMAALVTVLCNELLRSEGRIVLALDDYQQITAPDVHGAISQLIEQAPAGLHLALMTRSDPPLPLARLRARGQMQEIRGPQLRFSLAETGAFMRRALGQPLPEADVAALWQRTEGWAAGLQLATLSLQRGEDAGRVIADFSGRQPDVFDYLVEEVVARQEAHVRQFLLQTSVLPRLNARLCNAVTGGEDAEALLHELYRANLFLVALDESEAWYRYHPLFAEALRQRLRASQSLSESTLHARAAAWFAQAGMAEEAVAQALKAGDFELAADLIARFGQRTWTANRPDALLGWLEALPEALVRRRPYLGLLRAWSLWLTSRWFAVGPALEAAEASLQAASAQAKEAPRAELEGMAAAIRASLALSEQQPARAARHAEEALQRLPPENMDWRAIVAQVLGDSYRALGDWEAAAARYEEAVAMGQARGNVYAALSALRSRAEVFHLQGQLRSAEAVYRRALQAAEALDGQRLSATANVHIWLGRLLCEWHELEEAQGHLEAGIAICRPQTYAVGLIMGHAELAQVHALRGDGASAWASWREAQGLAGAFPLENMERYLQRVAGELHLAQASSALQAAEGNDAQALQGLQALASWAEGRGLRRDGPAEVHLEDGILYAHLLVLQGERGAAREALGRLRKRAQAEGRNGLLVRVLCLEALALTGDEQEAAGECLRRALALAAPERIVRPFVVAGSALGPLLKQVVAAEELARGTAAFARRVQAIVVSHAARQRAAAGGDSISFTGREQDVIPLLAAGLSNRQIAEEMVVAESTVKTHLSNIYGKLAVENRTQAVARLRDLDLI